MGISDSFLWIDAVCISGLTAWAYYVISVEPHNFVLARVLFAMSAAGIIAFGVVFDVISSLPIFMRIAVVGFVGALASIFATESFRLVANREGWVKTHENPTPLPILTSQVPELMDIDNFVGRGDEYELDDKFQLTKNFSYNVNLAKMLFFNNTVSDKDRKETEIFLQAAPAALIYASSLKDLVSEMDQF